MRIAVLGLGALGIAFSTFLKESGNTVTGITKPEYLERFKDRKLSVKGIWGEHQAVLDSIVSDPAEIKEDLDLIIITVKSYDTEKALNQIRSVVGQNTLILIAQNGYGNYEKAVELFGEKKVLLGRVIFGSKVSGRNCAQITVSADDVRIGDPSGKISEEKIQKVVKVIKESGIPASFSKDVYQILWDKILYNCALNPLGALLECSYGELAENENTRKIMNGIIEEIFLITNANNIKLRWRSPEEYIDHFYKNLIPPTAEHYPSMYYDLKTGKRTEIDALNGAIVKLGEKKGIKTPINSTITSLIKFKESKTL
ncbi:2-dehydropantoate 2-reductase [Persephonella hydrogeniphila]|uniref:2-dehydropantoate 2-reductase n=1 Tax=Persephonella hydrogeniphila TaxID=198703 RepID=A0A285NNX0_9AQUI|nr:2-dehydropantoate 2-reductase [Persephonella hydrogeniphila]SNZ11202.1 2-dehydropantoate 2-reductase [Persephonella hydrogeniphila]